MNTNTTTTTTTTTKARIITPPQIMNIGNMQYDTEFFTFREKLQYLSDKGFLTLTPWTMINMDFGIKLRLPVINFDTFGSFAMSYLEEINNPYDPMFEILYNEIVEILLPFMNTQFKISFTDNYILTPNNTDVKYINDDSIANNMIQANIWTRNDLHYFHMQRMYISFIYRAFFYILGLVGEILPQSIITSLDILIAFTNTLSDFTYLIYEKDLILGLITYFKCLMQKYSNIMTTLQSNEEYEGYINLDIDKNGTQHEYDTLVEHWPAFFNFNSFLTKIAPALVGWIGQVKAIINTTSSQNISDTFLKAMDVNILPKSMLDINRDWLLSQAFQNNWDDQDQATYAIIVRGTDYTLTPAERDDINIFSFFIESLMKYSNSYLMKYGNINNLEATAQQGGQIYPLLRAGGGGGGGGGGGSGRTASLMSHSGGPGPRAYQQILSGRDYGLLLKDSTGQYTGTAQFTVKPVTGNIRKRDQKVKVRYQTQKGGINEAWVHYQQLVAPSAILSASHQRAERAARRFQQSIDDATAAVAEWSELYARDAARFRHGLPYQQFKGVLDFINITHQKASMGFLPLSDQQGKSLPLGSNDPYCKICAAAGYKIPWSLHPKSMGGNLVQGGGKRKGKRKKSKRRKRKRRKRSRRPKKRRHKKTIKKRRKKKKTRRKK